MLLKFEAEVKILRPRLKATEADAEARGYEAEVEAQILAA